MDTLAVIALSGITFADASGSELWGLKRDKQEIYLLRADTSGSIDTVAKSPYYAFISVGQGAVWVGSLILPYVHRIDPKTGKAERILLDTLKCKKYLPNLPLPLPGGWLVVAGSHKAPDGKMYLLHYFGPEHAWRFSKAKEEPWVKESLLGSFNTQTRPADADPEGNIYLLSQWVPVIRVYSPQGKLKALLWAPLSGGGVPEIPKGISKGEHQKLHDALVKTLRLTNIFWTERGLAVGYERGESFGWLLFKGDKVLLKGEGKLLAASDEGVLWVERGGKTAVLKVR